jgi:hypothetical protein
LPWWRGWVNDAQVVINKALEDSDAFLEVKEAAARGADAMAATNQAGTDQAGEVQQVLVLAQGNVTDVVPHAKSLKLDTLLKPKDVLSRTMSLDEFNQWLEKFEAYLEWNKTTVDDHQLSEKTKRQLLNDCIDANLAAALKTDEKVTDETTMRDHDGCLKRLEVYFLEEHTLTVAG